MTLAVELIGIRTNNNSHWYPHDTLVCVFSTLVCVTEVQSLNVFLSYLLNVMKMQYIWLGKRQTCSKIDWSSKVVTSWLESTTHPPRPGCAPGQRIIHGWPYELSVQVLILWAAQGTGQLAKSVIKCQLKFSFSSFLIFLTAPPPHQLLANRPRFSPILDYMRYMLRCIPIYKRKWSSRFSYRRGSCWLALHLHTSRSFSSSLVSNQPDVWSLLSAACADVEMPCLLTSTEDHCTFSCLRSLFCTVFPCVCAYCCF